MAHISSIGAGLYSDLAVTTAAFTGDFETLTETQMKDLFDNSPSGNEYVRITNVREFPAMGTPPNVVNVPVYGQKTSQQIQGQSDAPSMEITLNYIASDWAAGTALGGKVGNGSQYAFRFTLLNAEPTGYNSNAAGLGTAQNSQYYWVGKMEALLVNPQLTDANTATLTISVQSEFRGAYTS